MFQDDKYGLDTWANSMEMERLFVYVLGHVDQIE